MTNSLTSMGGLKAKSLVGLNILAQTTGGDSTAQLKQGFGTAMGILFMFGFFWGVIKIWSGANAISKGDVDGKMGIVAGITLAALTAHAQQTITGQLTVNGPVVAGTNSSTDDLEFRLDGTLIAKGAVGTGSMNSTDLNNGAKMIWYPGKAAFIAGWFGESDSDIGQYSAAFGYNSKASGTYSFATGNGSTASGQFATALGYGNTASGSISVSIGSTNVSSGTSTITLGGGNVSNGFVSFAGGGSSYSGGWGSFSFGNTAYAGGGMVPVSMGYGTISNGNQTAAFCDHTSALSYDCFAIGRYNQAGISSGGQNPNGVAWVATEPLFEIGNGADATHTADAVVVYKNGNMAVQGGVRFSPSGDLSMGGFTAGTHP